MNSVLKKSNSRQKPLPSDNFNIHNKNVILSKYILVFDIQIKTRCVKWLK